MIIIGASGSGKSSLLKASVLPQLDAPARRMDRAARHPAREGADRGACQGARAACGQAGRLARLARELSGPTAPRAIERLVQDAASATHAAPRVLLPIDQFEECFTTTPAAERDAFLACSRPRSMRDLPFMVIATGRSDVLEGLIEVERACRPLSRPSRCRDAARALCRA